MAKVELIWHQEMQFKVSFSDDSSWVRWVNSLDRNLDPTNLDAVYEYLNTGQGLSQDVLEEMAGNDNWINTVDCEVDDLVRIPDEPVVQDG